jgi:uncharacterized membrane protein YfhO
VNGALLGVPIPAGASSIELSYQPTELIAGAAVSTITLILIITLLIISSRKRSTQ